MSCPKEEETAAAAQEVSTLPSPAQQVADRFCAIMQLCRKINRDTSTSRRWEKQDDGSKLYGPHKALLSKAFHKGPDYSPNPNIQFEDDAHKRLFMHIKTSNLSQMWTAWECLAKQVCLCKHSLFNAS